MSSAYLKQTYLAAIRALRNNPWITLKGKDEPLLDDLARTLEAKNMEVHDYIQFHFKQKKLDRTFFPSVKYICSPKAIQAYEVHQKMKGKYVTRLYAIDGNDFYVNATFKKYPLKQVESSVSDDAAANYVITTLEQDGYPITSRLKEDAQYTLCKFAYKGKTPPDKLTDFLKKEKISQI